MPSATEWGVLGGKVVIASTYLNKDYDSTVLGPLRPSKVSSSQQS